MKRNIIKQIVIAIAITIVGGAQTKAQSINSFREQSNIDPGIESWQLTRQGNLSPSLYTGAMQWTLPLYTYKDPDFELPIALEYFYDGFKPREATGSVGLGWALNAGGVITREVRGLRDEHLFMKDYDPEYIYGYYYAWKQSLTINSGSNFSLLRDNLHYAVGIDYGDMTFMEMLSENLPGNTLMCRATAYQERYDIEPDIFRFNFCGHSGEFRFGNDGAIQVISSNESNDALSIDVREMEGPDCRTFYFIITTADGYKYTFGSNEHSFEYSTSTCYSTDDPKGLAHTFLNGDQTITAWKLTSIESPSGRKLVFEYDHYYDIEATTHKSYTPYLEAISANEDSLPSYMERRLNLCRTRLLKQIALKVNNRTVPIATFSWSERTDAQDEHCTANYRHSSILQEIQTVRTQKNRCLSSITVRNANGNEVECITLGYNTLGSSSGPRKLLLSFVNIKKSGKWNFEYNQTPSNDSLPTADVEYVIDIFGYWGGSSSADLRGCLPSYLRGSLQQNASTDYSLPREQTGALHKIIYPTGGHSIIEYEKNHVKKLLDRTWAQKPFLQTFNHDVCGIRVAKITDYDGSEAVSAKEFQYDDGVFWQQPRLCVECLYYKQVFHPINASSFLMPLKATFYSSNGFNTYGYGQRLGYEVVTELHSDGSRTVHTFFGWNHYPDSFPESVSSTPLDILPYNDEEATKMLNMFECPSSDYSLFRGLPKSISEYDALDNLRYHKEFSYVPEAPSVVYEAMNCMSLYACIPHFRMKPLLHTIMESKDGLSVKTKFDMDPQGRLSSKTVIDLQSNREIEESYSYCTNYSSDDASVCFGAVRDVVTIVKEESSQNRFVTDFVRFGYNRADGSAKPTSMTVYKLDKPEPDSLRSRIPGSKPCNVTRITRDSKLLPTRVDYPGGAYITYTWDALGRNISSRTVNGTQGKTTYTWKDMVGLSSLTLPSGLSASYSYDYYGRLSEERNSDGNAVRHIEGRLGCEYGGLLSRIATKTVLDENDSSFSLDVDYYDALGRKSQSVYVGDPGAFPSIIQPFKYDSMDRADSVAFLPYATDTIQTMNPAIVYQNLWETKSAEWYEATFGEGSRPFYIKEYEPWKGGRVLSEQKPGTRYQQEGKKVVFQYGKNTTDDAVLRLSFAMPSASNAFVKCSGLWDDDKLQRTTRVSEEGDTTVIFSDVAGQTILSRSINNGSKHDTYFIRDLKDSLVMVIQPEGSSRINTGTIIPFNGTFAHDYCFGWLYDGFGRLVWKHNPGDGGTNFAYDRRGRLAYSDDANLRASSKGRYYLYDDYDRLTEEGICYPSTNYAGICGGLDSGVSIKTMCSSCQDTHKLAYRTSSSALATNGIPLDMSFASVAGVVSSSDINRERCLSMLSFEQLREIGNSMGNNTRRAYWYDGQGRLIQMLEKTSDGWTARYSTKYDFVGNPIKYCEQHTDPSGITHTLLVENTYDSRGRITRCVRTLDGVTLDPVEYGYDGLGRTSDKTRNGANEAFKLRQTVERDLLGWISEINVVHPVEGTLFDEAIAYRLDGLIDEVTTYNCPRGDPGTPIVRNKYSYDHLGRLLGNSRWVDNAATDVRTEKNIQYDLNGNITFLRRNINGTAQDIYFGYEGNQITGGCINPQTDFIEFWFTNDLNGNLTSDNYYNNIIEYNFLNLPSMVGDVTYTYLSDGTRLSARKANGVGVITRGSFSYAIDASGAIRLESVGHSEGRIYVGNSGELKDCWNISDHLGNVRSVINPDGMIGSLWLEQSDYLPFGMRINELSDQLGDAQRWHLAGKEYQKFGSFDLGLVDFGARYYLPMYCRWTSVDPMAKSFSSISPFSYCNNNPISIIDKNGLRSIPLKDQFKEWIIKIDSWFGLRDTKEKDASKNHKGLDFNYSGGGDTDLGAPVLAAHEGIVSVHESTDGAAGRYVTITAPDESVKTKYFHLSSTKVKEGDYVGESQEIGTMGGSADGKENKWSSHLHYEIHTKKDGKWTPINPSKDGTNTVESLIDPQLMIDESSKLYYGGKLPAAYIISSPYQIKYTIFL